jgi:C-terminal processing protease CtpA/Prc
MQEETADRHLAVSIVRQESTAAPPKDAERVDRAQRGRRDNFGLRRLEILAGNVGYLNLTAFYRPEEARKTIVAAMRALRNADALIVDLRQNGGGSTGTVALCASFLFDEPGLPLFDIVDRAGERSPYATEKQPLCGRNDTQPVWVLAAASTFSGGEGLAFLLQERHRAEVVGERTAGAANPGRPCPL